MSYPRLTIVAASLLLSACSFSNKQGTLAELQDVNLELKDVEVTDGLEKAMMSYRRFLEETPESAMTPEAIRRIADLSIEKEYGYIADAPATRTAGNTQSRSLDKPATSAPLTGGNATASGTAGSAAISGMSDESEKDFEARVARGEEMQGSGEEGFSVPSPQGGDDLDNANARQAIELYTKLLQEYPLYERNDQVLYQMSRAYEELGETEKAMEVMNRFIKAYPNSRYMDEVQFRRAEYFFTRKKYLDSEDAYQSIVAMGPSSSYYELALYKLGWSFYKQDLYEEALHRYIALLDYKVSIGYDFNQEHDKTESKRMDDTFRVISLSFSNLGGPDSVTEYFSSNGSRNYEDKVYSQLGEFYLTKRRYNDAAGSYKAYVGLYPYAEVSPSFQMRVIDIYMKGGFGRLVVESKKEYAKTYALDSDYWRYFEVSERPDVISDLKANLKDLANHYHALYQDKRFEKEKGENYAEALLWYRNYLSSFPQEEETPAIHYQMADLMLENKDYGDAAVAYESTAYNYPRHEKSSEAGYAAVYAYREQLKVVPQGQRDPVKQRIIRSSLKFADTYPEHEKVTIVLGAAADDLYEMNNYELAIKTAHKLIDNYPTAEKELLRAAWLVVGHASFDLKLFADAEAGYVNVLSLSAPDDKEREAITNNLAASIYKQGEQANLLEDYRTAAEHFLRVGRLAPNSEIRPTAEFDGATALIQLEDWGRAAEVLTAFRRDYPQHELQPEVTKKIAFVYRADGKIAMAAAEYERIERESQDDDVRRGALVIAAELYKEAGDAQKELAVYRRYVEYFPKPLEEAMETYNKMAEVYQTLGDNKGYLATLETMVSADRAGGAERTDRTQYLAAQAALVLTEPLYQRFLSVQLVAPLQENMLRKKDYMQAAVKGYSKLVEYGVADVTAAATYYIAEIYYHFSRALMKSERPTNLSALEMEQYELALEDQIFPFEEKAIDIHKKNIELLHTGIHSNWIDKSIAKLAQLFPAIYAREEQGSGFV
ncbi:MAG TPA: tetratricopeptide repeat protein, partial [Gammaproteobacteria bacterium]